MRLRVLPLPSQPQQPIPDPDTRDTVWETPFVFVFDGVTPDERRDLDEVTRERIRESTGARGALIFRGSVDLPEVD